MRSIVHTTSMGIIHAVNTSLSGGLFYLLRIAIQINNYTVHWNPEQQSITCLNYWHAAVIDRVCLHSCHTHVPDSPSLERGLVRASSSSPRRTPLRTPYSGVWPPCWRRRSCSDGIREPPCLVASILVWRHLQPRPLSNSQLHPHTVLPFGSFQSHSVPSPSEGGKS